MMFVSAMFGDVLQRFVDRSPATFMVRGLLEHLLNPAALDQWFEDTGQNQHTPEILFSSLVGMMLQIVCKTQASVHAAYRHANIATSIVSVYAKLHGIELSTSQALVRPIASDAHGLIGTLGAERPAMLPGYRVKFLDGNCLAATEHRLKAARDLRRHAAGQIASQRSSSVASMPGWSLNRWKPCAGSARPRPGRFMSRRCSCPHRPVNCGRFGA